MLFCLPRSNCIKQGKLEKHFKRQCEVLYYELDLKTHRDIGGVIPKTTHINILQKMPIFMEIHEVFKVRFFYNHIQR